MPFTFKTIADIKLEDSNMWKVGSAEDKAHRKEVASKEPAWEGAGKEAGIKVWRVEHFTLVPVVEDVGKFHKGDSYIVLHTEKGEGDVFIHHIYFWLGAETSTDEQGTAAYKTVELDDFMDGEPTEHREVQGSESAEFKALFPNLEYLDGGVDSGFKHVVPGEGVHDTKMYQARRTKGHVTIIGCPVKMQSLEGPTGFIGDSFVLDAPEKIYLYHGPDGNQSNAFEKNRAGMHAEHLESKREGRAKVTDEIDDEFWKLLGGSKPDWA